MIKRCLKTLAISSITAIWLLGVPVFSLAAVNSNISVVTSNSAKEKLLGVQAQNNEVRNTRNCKRIFYFCKRKCNTKGSRYKSEK